MEFALIEVYFTHIIWSSGFCESLDTMGGTSTACRQEEKEKEINLQTHHYYSEILKIANKIVSVGVCHYTVNPDHQKDWNLHYCYSTGLY